MNVVIYARYSCSNQREESIEGQLKVCYEFAQRNNYNVICEYIDEAISGRTDKRPQFLKMIQDSKERYFEGVLVYQLDRFSRSKYDNAIYKKELKNNGVRVISARENITEDASGIMLEGLLESMSEYYSAELSQKVRRGLKVNAEKGISTGGQIPLGLYLDKTRHFQIDVNSAHIVKLIFEMYSCGNTMAEIIRLLNSKGYKTSKGNKFTDNSLNKILRNKKYIGYYIYDDIEIPNAIPAIIDETTFYKCQEIMKKNKKAPARTKAKEEYLLSTKLFCGECNSLMTGLSAYGRNKNRYAYYKCKNVKDKLCNTKSVNKGFIEDIVVNETKKILTNHNIETIAQKIVQLCKSSNSNELDFLNKELNKTNREIENLLKVVEQGRISEIILDRIDNKKKRIEDIEKQISIEKLKTPDLNVDMVKQFLYSFKDGKINDLVYRKNLINTFVNKVILYENKLTILYNVQDCQSNVLFNTTMVSHQGVEPRTFRLRVVLYPIFTLNFDILLL